MQRSSIRWLEGMAVLYAYERYRCRCRENQTFEFKQIFIWYPVIYSESDSEPTKLSPLSRSSTQPLIDSLLNRTLISSSQRSKSSSLEPLLLAILHLAWNTFLMVAPRLPSPFDQRASTMPFRSAKVSRSSTQSNFSRRGGESSRRAIHWTVEAGKNTDSD